MNQKLNVEPISMNSTWSQKYDADAAKEGWSIFDCNDSENSCWQLCRIDDTTSLPEPKTQLGSDNEAWKIVAMSTGEHHVAARQFLKWHNPKEYAAIMTPRVGDRVYLEPEAAFVDEDYKIPVPAGWYILHAVRTVSGLIDSPDAWVTLCRENNEPGDYITSTAEKIHLQQPWYKCRLVNADIWKDNDEEIVFPTLMAVVKAGDEFLNDALKEGLDYSGKDLEIITEDGVIDFIDARQKLFPKKVQGKGANVSDTINEASTNEKREALEKLKEALLLCTETGLFDEMTNDVHPDLINAFCDEAGRFELVD